MAEEENNGSSYRITGDRRDNSAIIKAISAMDKNLSERLTKLETQREDQKPRCETHSNDIRALAIRQEGTESIINKAIGGLKVASVGIPAFGSIAYFVMKLAKFAQGKP